MVILATRSHRNVASILVLLLLLTFYLFYAWQTVSSSKATKLVVDYNNELKLNIFKTENVSELFDRMGIKIPVTYNVEVARNSPGTKIIVNGDGLFSSTCWVVTLSDEVQVKKLEKPARMSFIDDDCNFVAWTDDIKEGLHFANGETLPLSSSSRVGFDLSSTYLFVTESGVTKIIKARDPRDVLAESKMSATHIFLLNDTLYLFGHPSSGHFVGNPVVCQMFRIIEEKSLNQGDLIMIGRAGYFSSMHVVDMDLASKKVLLKSRYDPPATFLSSWYVYDLCNNTLEKYSRIENGKQYGLFLSVNILG